MAGTHREFVNNNVLFVDEGNQEQKTLQKWHYNDANEVRDIKFQALFYAHKLYFELLPNTKVLFITHLT